MFKEKKHIGTKNELTLQILPMSYPCSVDPAYYLVQDIYDLWRGCRYVVVDEDEHSEYAASSNCIL